MRRPRYAAAALLLAALSGCGAGATPPTPTEHAAATTVAWWDQGVLHAGGATIETRERDLVSAGRTTLVGHDAVDGSRWWLVDGDHLVPLLESATLVRPVLAPDGRAVVWVDEADRTRHGRYRSDIDYRVVHYDVGRQQVDAGWETHHEVTCCDAGGSLTATGIGTDGRVVLGFLGGEQLVWTPGREPVPLSGPGVDRLSIERWPGGVMWQDDGAVMTSPGRYGTVGADGGIAPAGSVPTDQLGLWSPDGAVYAYFGDATGDVPLKVALDRVWAQDLSGRRTELAMPTLPDGAAADLAAWESPTALLLEVRRPYGEGLADPGVVGFVRCDVTTAACVWTSDEPGPRARLPERW